MVNKNRPLARIRGWTQPRSLNRANAAVLVRKMPSLILRSEAKHLLLLWEKTDMEDLLGIGKSHFKDNNVMVMTCISPLGKEREPLPYQ